MTTIKYTLLLIIGLSIHCSTIFAQKKVVPGYQGKRLLVGADFSAMVAWNYVNANGKTLDGNTYRLGDDAYGVLPISGRWSVNANYVLGRRLTGTFSVGTGKTGLLTEGVFQNNTADFTFQREGFFNIGYNFATLGIQMQKKKKWGLAPIGPFWGARYLVARANLPKVIKMDLTDEYLLDDASDCDCTVVNLLDGDTGENINHGELFHSVQFVLGNRSIIKNRFYIESAMTITPITTFYFAGDNIHSRFRSLFFSNVRIGFGILL